MEDDGMADRKRVDRVELGPTDRAKAVDISAREFVCTAAGKVKGDLDAETAEVRGACKVEGDVSATILKVSGSMKVGGSVASELVRVKGALKIQGDLSADNLRISGATKVAGSIKSSEEIFVQGVLGCTGDIEAVKFTLLGVVDVEGTLKAAEFSADLAGKSSAHTLDAETIIIKKGQQNGSKAEFLAKNIRGADIYLENTIAEEVAGRKVVIGPGCSIAQVKGEEVEIHPSSKVGKRL